MARSKGILRYLSIVWDRGAARRMEQEAEASAAKTGKGMAAEFETALGEGGKKAGRVLTTSLEREYRIRMGRARQALAQGAIDERAFEREGRVAAAAFDKGLSAGIKRIGASGSSTDLELAQLAGRFKTKVGGGAGAAAGAGMLSGLWGPLAGYFTADAAARGAREAFREADLLEQATFKLAATAKVAGINLSFLQAESKKLQDTLHLSVPVANDLTGAMAKLASRSGDVNQTGQALTAFLDLAAANGMGATQALDVLNQTLNGSDEGLNRLGLANPEQIFTKWGAGTDEASRAQALLNELMESGGRALGAYAARSETAAGKQDDVTKRLNEAQAAFGEAFNPVRVGILSDFANFLNDIAFAGNTVAGAYHKIGDAWNRLWGIGSPPSFGDVESGRTSTAPAVGRLPGITVKGMTAAERRAADAEAERKRKELQKELDKRVQATLEVPLGPTGSTRSRQPVTSAGTVLGEMDLALRAMPQETGRATKEALAGFNDFEQLVHNNFDNIVGYAGQAAGEMSAAFEGFFTQMFESGANLGDFFQAVGQGMAASILGGLAQIAQGEAMQAAANMLKAAARTLLFGDPKAAASIPVFAAEMAAWSALAGFTGAARGAVTGGAGAIPPSTRDAGLGIAERAERTGAEVHIYIDPLDPSRPAYQRNVYAANQYARERFGEDARVSVHPYRGDR